MRGALLRELSAGAMVAALSSVVRPASAVNPLEYPDNGSTAFSRGGAWLAVGNEPIAAHYDPAALAIAPSAFSIEQQLNFAHTCFDRRGPNDAVTGPDVTGAPFYEYRAVCSARGSFPNTIPSIAVTFRVTDRLGIGMAIVPPSTYGTAQGQFPALARGFDDSTHRAVMLPAPYRYLELEQQSTILFPTLGLGYEVAPHFRVGAAFIAGFADIALSTMAVSNLQQVDARGDHMMDDSLSSLRTADRFVPGAIVSLHWSVTPVLDLALWGRFIDAIRTHQGTLDVTQQAFDANGGQNPPCAGAPGAGGVIGFTGCTTNQGVPNHFADAITRFEYRIPPEIRWAVRVHAPRARAAAGVETGPEIRDPLHDDIVDVELDQSLTLDSFADTIVVRFKESDGKGALPTSPSNAPVPPNADRPTGYRDSFGVRLGAQWNAIRDLFGIRAGGWFETQSQDPRFLTVAPVGAARFGFGGGLVVRYHFMDISVGYQRHLTAGLDNHGFGALRAPAAVGTSPFDLNAEPPGVSAAARTQFRTVHAVNGGSVTLDAHVFTLGGVVRF